MRTPSAILRSLSLRRIQPRQSSATVAPLPTITRFNRDLTAELTAVQSLDTTSENVMPQLFDVAITTQKIALNSLSQVSYLGDVDLGAMEEYLETNIDVLDACNYFVERIEDLKKYMDSLRNVARFVETNATSRALENLESCHDVEKRLKVLRKCGLRKVLLRQKLGQESEFGEIVCGSKVMALMCCEFLEHVLSFDCSKSGLVMVKQNHHHPSSWLRLMQDLAEGSGEKKKGSFVMNELQETVNAARELKELIKGKKGKENVRSCVERVRRTCKGLEGRLDLIEGKVRDLYKNLIDVRMVLLGILSKA